MRRPAGVSVTSAANAAPAVMSLIAALKRSTPASQNRARWGPRRCATPNPPANSDPTTSNCKRKTILLAIALLCALPVLAQKTSGPKYDLSAETKMKGTVEEVKLPGTAKEIAHLSVKVGADTVDVYLCPKSFLDDMGVSFSKGDEISLTGSKVKQGDADMILAREIVKGTDTVVFRDEKGNPVW